jgi:hypothetical protein
MGSMKPFLVLVFASALAVPPAPCALWGSCGTGAQAAEELASGSCCQRHARSDDAPATPAPSGPCSRDCCRVKPVAPAAKDLAVDHAPAVAVASWTLPAEAAFSGAQAPSLQAPPVRSLQILLCQWRC